MLGLARVSSCALFVLTLSFAAGLGLCPQVPPAAAAEPTTGPPREVELFAAERSGQISLTVIPRDSTRITVQVKNLSDRPLKITLPEGFAAVPVLAQIDPGFPGLGPPAGGGNQGGGNQAVGGPFGNGNNGFFNNGNGGGRPNNNFPPGLFNILPGKTIKRQFPCVCLEHGKPDPNPRIAYRLQPIETFSDDARIAALIARWNRQRFSRRVAQLAAWHLANGKTWKELANLHQRHVNGRATPLYSAQELAAARTLVQQLPRAASPGERVATTGGD